MKAIRKRVVALALLAAMTFGALPLPMSKLTKVYAAGASAQTVSQSAPSSITVREGEKVTVSVPQAGEGSSYQWYYKKAGVAQWSLWKGHTSAVTSATSNSTWHGM